MSQPSTTSPWTQRLRASSRIQHAAIGAGLVLYAVVAIGMLWNGSGVRGAARDARAASERVRIKQREVDDALRLLERRLAELRAAREEAASTGVRMEEELVRAGLLDTLGAAAAIAAIGDEPVTAVVPVALEHDDAVPTP